MPTPRRAPVDSGYRSARPGWLAWGLAGAIIYLVTAAGSWPFPIRLLYDGLIPLPPYRWVHPPPDRAKTNQPAQPGSGTIPLGPRGSEATEISTGDDQALVTLPQAAFALRASESSVKVVITPLDPATVAPAPQGPRFDGNAYRVDASYAASATPVALARPMTVVLRYPVHATAVLRAQDAGWIALQSTRFDGSQQVLANTDRLGIFVPGLPSGRGWRPPPGSAYLAVFAGLAAAITGTALARRHG